MRTVVIGDIHGCCKALDALLEKCKVGKEDQLVFLGDLMDRGPDSYEVFAKARELKESMRERFVPVMGNHEDLLINAIVCHDMGLWYQNGGQQTKRSFQKNGADLQECVEWIRNNMPYYYDGGNFLCVHGGLCDEVPPSEQERQILLWDRSMIRRNAYGGRLAIVGHTPLEKPAYFDGSGGEAKRLFYGRWIKLPETGMIDIDTGCAFYGRLTGMVIDGDKFQLKCVYTKDTGR